MSISILVSVKIDTSGFDRLINIRPSLVPVVQIGAHHIEKRAKELVPVDTGATKNSIHPMFSNDGMEVAIGPTTEYAPHLEFGTSKMAARPFMIPAIDAERRPFAAAVGGVVKRLSS